MTAAATLRSERRSCTRFGVGLLPCRLVEPDVPVPLLGDDVARNATESQRPEYR